ncbi:MULTISPECIES: glycosyltransferase family 2 protein [unclassified Bradyrhizobium]|uniref:glycosyltransferase family 2 protein n=1 Tax=unclassified Bradyrhizobium TaxID=2631580 RepID=UPI001FFFBCC8|nr:MULTISPECIES: glycosyltransferase family 2 protein [unclassified Bradyrhizobium]UPJ26024.1 glycosyltransferase family 2 protein [Bradyrhizobium sp. CW1]UPJ94588.1 glycosyltransferase family 2 protein [Bradyrhizobium sp. 172]
MNDHPTAIVILTRNEEINIGKCIQHHQQHCDVYVIDSESTDRTKEIAESLGAKVIERTWSGFADQRNFALDTLGPTYEWLIFIDADEMFDAAVFDFVKSRAYPSESDVIYVSQTIYLNGKPLRYAPGYPIYHPRIARTSRARFSQNQSGHGEMIDATKDLKTYHLDIPYKHFITSHGVDQWLVKHISLARLEASQVKQVNEATTARMRLSLLIPDNILRPLIRFAYHYMIKGGFRDGREGLVFSVMYMWFELSKWIIRTERRYSQH